jgi:hypothetical protein
MLIFWTNWKKTLRQDKYVSKSDSNPSCSLCHFLQITIFLLFITPLNISNWKISNATFITSGNYSLSIFTSPLTTFHYYIPYYFEVKLISFCFSNACPGCTFIVECASVRENKACTSCFYSQLRNRIDWSHSMIRVCLLEKRRLRIGRESPPDICLTIAIIARQYGSENFLIFQKSAKGVF